MVENEDYETMRIPARCETSKMDLNEKLARTNIREMSFAKPHDSAVVGVHFDKVLAGIDAEK